MKIRWLLLIFILGLFWRFINYQNRLVLNQDQARDAIIGLQSISLRQLPPIGPPSSAGPFNFGPYYYWLITFFTLLIPVTGGPWIGFSLLSAISIFFYYRIGRKMINSRFGLLLAVMSAVNPALVAISPDMLNTTALAFLSPLVFLLLINYVHRPKIITGLLFGFFLGVTANFHFQAFGLFALLPLIFLINRYSIVKRLSLILPPIAGLLISFLPLIVFDFQHHHRWLLSVINYYTTGVTKFYTPIRWLTDIRDFWPQHLGQTITGIPLLGYILIILFLAALYFKQKKGLQFSPTWGVLVFSFIIQILLLRYYRGTRSSEYLIYLYPYSIIFTGWALHSLYSLSPKLSLLAGLLLFATSTYTNFSQTFNHPSQAQVIYSLKSQIDQKLNPESISLYSLNNPDDQLNSPIFYLYYRQNKINTTGSRIATCNPLVVSNPCPSAHKILAQSGNYYLYDVTNIPHSQLLKQGFVNYTPDLYRQRLMVNYPE
ncbi:MAG: glycosyltransferase family 39 protein [Candidatus Shapirobacteria bacterium]|jgi:hypothetical protein